MNADEIKHILVIGAGTMGHSIAQVYAQAGIDVELVDVNQNVLDTALLKIESNLNLLAEFGRINKENIPKIIDHVHPNTNLALVAKDVELVVEAVSEVPALKEKIFSQLSDYCNENTVLTSNTSGLDIFRIARKIKNLDRLIIQHWCCPAHIIPLVEIVSGRKTSQEIIDLNVKLMERLGKKPIVINKFEELFIVNKIQLSIGSAIIELLLKGLATPEMIDLALKYTLGIRIPIVGIAQSFDFTGLDVIADVLKNQGIEFGLIKEKVEQGQLGVKSSRGIYDYGGRGEQEIIDKRDRLYLKMLAFLEEIKAFDPL